MPLEQLILLAIVQGLTEFLPISSSGHLNLIHLLTRWPDQGVLMDAAVHLGSLFAVIIYFRKEVLSLITGFCRQITGTPNGDGRLAIYLGIATLPLLIAGVILLKTGWIAELRTAKTIAWANIIFAVVLWIADRSGRQIHKLSDTTLGSAFLVGLAQALALIPGTSRAGITMTMARFCGFTRIDAARLSMLLSIPAILAAGGAAGLELYGAGDLALTGDAALAAGLAFIAALAAIAFMMALLKRMSLLPFVIYRIVLGAALLGWVYWQAAPGV